MYSSVPTLNDGQLVRIKKTLYKGSVSTFTYSHNFGNRENSRIMDFRFMSLDDATKSIFHITQPYFEYHESQYLDVARRLSIMLALGDPRYSHIHVSVKVSGITHFYHRGEIVHVHNSKNNHVIFGPPKEKNKVKIELLEDIEKISEDERQLERNVQNPKQEVTVQQSKSKS